MYTAQSSASPDPMVVLPVQFLCFRYENSGKQRQNSGRSRCFADRRTAGGRGSPRRSPCRPLIIYGKNSKTAGTARSRLPFFAPLNATEHQGCPLGGHERARRTPSRRDPRRRCGWLLAADGRPRGRTAQRLKAHRRELVDPKIREHRGRIVKTTGDGLLVEFPSVVDAVRSAATLNS